MVFRPLFLIPVFNLYQYVKDRSCAKQFSINFVDPLVMLLEDFLRSLRFNFVDPLVMLLEDFSAVSAISARP